MLRHLDSLVRKSLVVADHSRPAHAVRPVRDDPAVRRRPLDGGRRAPSARETGTRRHFARQAAAEWEHWNGPGWREAVDWVELELGNLRSAFRWSAGPRRRRGGDRHRRPRRADGVLGAAVRDARRGQRSCSRRRRRPTCPACPACTPAAGYACFAGRPDAARRNAHRATELEADGRLRPVRAGLLDVRRGARPGVLRRPRSLHRAHRRGRPALRRRRAGTAWRRTSTGSSRRAGSRRRSRSPRSRSPRPATSATRTGCPTRSGSPAWRSRSPTGAAPSPRGTKGSPSCASTGSSSSRGSSPATQAACTRPTASPRRRSMLFAEAIAAFHRAGNVPQLDHHAGERAGVVRAARTTRAGGDAARRDVAAAVELPPRARAGRARASSSATALGGTRTDELDATGAAFDLERRRRRTPVEQIDAARRDPTPRVRPARPGGLSRRELEVLRLVAGGRTSGEIADRAVHLDAHRRAPHRRTSTPRSASRTAPRRLAGPSRTASSTTPSLAEPGRSADTCPRKWVDLPMP